MRWIDVAEAPWMLLDKPWQVLLSLFDLDIRQSLAMID
jgi:hypothetical protein